MRRLRDAALPPSPSRGPGVRWRPCVWVCSSPCSTSRSSRCRCRASERIWTRASTRWCGCRRLSADLRGAAAGHRPSRRPLRSTQRLPGGNGDLHGRGLRVLDGADDRVADRAACGAGARRVADQSAAAEHHPPDLRPRPTGRGHRCVERGGQFGGSVRACPRWGARRYRWVAVGLLRLHPAGPDLPGDGRAVRAETAKARVASTC